MRRKIIFTHADQTQENKSRSVSSDHSQIQSGGESTFQFVDNRPEAVAQRNLQEMANNSPQVSQLKALHDTTNNSLQAKQARHLERMADNHSSQPQQPIQKKENNTGLPDILKTGVENLSGMSLDDVKVHRNSDKPAQLQAHAYTQGTDIHLGPRQEKHLPHEAWHDVQQKQGRVKPTMQIEGKVNVNDDAGLEKEADVIGAKASQMKGYHPIGFPVLNTGTIIQRMVINLDADDEIINKSVPNVAKREFTRDKFSKDKEKLDPEEEAQAGKEMQTIIKNHHKNHQIIMNRAAANFAGLEDSGEPIIFVGHGTFTGEFDKKLGGLGYLMRIFKPQLAMSLKFWNSFSGEQLGKYLIKKGLPKSYRGQIYADGCNTATGPEVGAPKAFIDELADYLQKKGYKYVSVKGNLGWASTKDDGTEENESPMIKSKLDEIVFEMRKIDPTPIELRNGRYDVSKWGFASELSKVKRQLEESPEDEKLKRDIQGLSAAIPASLKNSWGPKHENVYRKFIELNNIKEIDDFVRVRAPMKIKI